MKVLFLRPLQVLVALCVLAFGFTLTAADPVADRFRELDTNADGTLQGDELADEPLIRRLDLDQDGALTLEEARRAVRGTIGQLLRLKLEGGAMNRFDQLDRNEDSILSEAELPNERLFRLLDQDQDGQITRSEAQQLLGQPRTQTMPDASEAPMDQRQVDRFADSPQRMRGVEFGVGSRYATLPAVDLKGSPVNLAAGEGILLVGYFTPHCPLSRKLAPEFKRLESEYPHLTIAWVCPIPAIEISEIEAFIAEHQLTSPVYRDASGELSARLDAVTTTETFLFDAQKTLRYRGAIHDQYGVGYARDEAKQTFLRDALAALKSQSPVPIAATTAPGCALDLEESHNITSTHSSTTYYNHISRILQDHCIECHRDGGIGPFALESYDDVLENAGMIRRQVERGLMPPWFASEDQSGFHGLFSNDRSLTADDQAMLLAWLNGDRPAGDPAEAPLPLSFPETWSIGEPDLILSVEEPVAVKAEGTMPYEYRVLETELEQDQWVQGYEILPSAREVVHHVIVQVFEPGQRLRRQGEGQGGFWAAYVPGNSHRIFPDKHAKKLPAGSRLQLQIHYTPIGVPMEDQIQVGLLFADSPPTHEVAVRPIVNPRIRIPAGAENHVETMERRLDQPMTISGYMPHLHTRGKAFRYEALLPDGEHLTLLDIPRYDFNWQLQYQYFDPITLPADTRIRITAVYDNSANNPANPDPTKTVRWGSQTWDEMMIGYIEHYERIQDVAEAD